MKIEEIVNKKYFFLPLLCGLFILMHLWFFWNRNRGGEMEGVSSFFAFAGALLFLVANAYYPARLIARQFQPWPKSVAVFFRKYLKLHIYLNLIAFLAVTIHGYLAEEWNIVLTLCYITTIALTIQGLLMHYVVVPGMQKHLRMLHTQQALFVVWAMLIIVGHMLD